MTNKILRQRFEFPTFLVINHPPWNTTKQQIQESIKSLVDIKILENDLRLEKRNNGLSVYVKMCEQKISTIIDKAKTQVFWIGREKVNVQQFYNCDIKLVLRSDQITDPKDVLSYFKELSKSGVAVLYAFGYNRKQYRSMYSFYVCFSNQADVQEIFTNMKSHFISNMPIKLSKYYKFGEHSGQDFKVSLSYYPPIKSGDMLEFKSELQKYVQEKFGTLRESVYINDPKNGSIQLLSCKKFKDEHKLRSLSNISEKIGSYQVTFQPQQSSKDLCFQTPFTETAKT